MFGEHLLRCPLQLVLVNLVVVQVNPSAYVFLYIILFLKKTIFEERDMIILVHENHDNLPIVTQMHHFVVVSNTQISQVLSVVPNIYQKIDLLMCCFFFRI